VKTRAPRNRTLFIEEGEADSLMQHVGVLKKSAKPSTIVDITNSVLHQDLFSCLEFLPLNCIDLLIIDPPYNLSKQYGKRSFGKMGITNMWNGLTLGSRKL
jgi:site-specific DNA-methyltransferase (adenine-specific)